MDDQLQALDQVRSAAVDLGMKFGPKVLVAIVILIAGYAAGRWAARASGRALARFHLDPPLRLLLARIVRVLVFALFAIMALQNLGVELLPLIAGLGVAGAGVALAMQGVLGNLVAGLTIIFTRPFRVGEYISIAKEEGEVLDVSLSSTVLGHADRSRIVIPNRKIVGEILHNYGGIRQLDIEVGISYGADAGAALKAIGEVLRGNARVLSDPAPGIMIARLADSGVTIGVNPWVKVPDHAAATSEINRAILEAFRARNIGLPVPQREIRLFGGLNSALAAP
jgi:small conductance mechanosensitive channel